MVGKGIRSAEMVAGKGEVLIRGVRTCLIEKVTFEGGERAACVEYPPIDLSKHHGQREPSAKASRWNVCLVCRSARRPV